MPHHVYESGQRGLLRDQRAHYAASHSCASMRACLCFDCEESGHEPETVAQKCRKGLDSVRERLSCAVAACSSVCVAYAWHSITSRRYGSMNSLESSASLGEPLRISAATNWSSRLCLRFASGTRVVPPVHERSSDPSVGARLDGEQQSESCGLHIPFDDLAQALIEQRSLLRHHLVDLLDQVQAATIHTREVDRRIERVSIGYARSMMVRSL